MTGFSLRLMTTNPGLLFDCFSESFTIEYLSYKDKILLQSKQDFAVVKSLKKLLRDEKSIQELEKSLSKAKALKLDATKVKNIVEAAQGIDLIVNALPIRFGFKVLDAALEAKTHYQDFAAADDGVTEWISGIKEMLTTRSDQFAAIGKSALISTGSAPGLANVIARHSVAELDSCDAIKIFVYEGVVAKRFLPFWWSPEVAYADMNDNAYIYEDGKILETKSFGRPVA